jgi:hypothetical protein
VALPALRRPDTARYALVLLLILCTVGFQLAAPDTDWARFATVLLQAATLGLALNLGHIHGLLDRVLIALVVAAVTVSAVALFGFASLGVLDARVINLLLIAFAPIAIIAGMLDDMRRRSRVTVRTIIGVLSVYLLIGLMFTFVYGIVGSRSHAGFFGSSEQSLASDYLYFSYATLTTVGYGDLTTPLRLGRSLAILEALIGQIYLVSVVSLIVGNLGRSPSGGPAPEPRHARRSG